MFQKPAFGATTTGFGSFNAGASTSSPFGGFKSTTGTSAFGAPPAFGAATATQPTTGGGLFGATNTTGGLFGGQTASTSTGGFGASTSGFGGFGANTSSGGLFGSNNTTTTGLFGANQNTSAFGAKPSFGFGSTAGSSAGTSGGLFGSTPTANTGLFGQQPTGMSGGTMFTNTPGGFGAAQPATGTAHVKYNPVVGTDMVVKGGNSQNVNIRHHCITCMKEYEGKSLEELRVEDYAAGRRGVAGGAPASNTFTPFHQPQIEHKPMFSANTFGQPATTSAPSVFGGGGLGTNTGFGQTSTFSFGGNTQNNANTSSLFGANKPAFGATQPATGGTGLFGTTTTQAPSFGTTSNTFGFGANTQPQTGGLFGAPATSQGGFGTSTGFGGFGGTSLFGAKTNTTTPAVSAAPTFGAANTPFGASTSTGGLFGANTFKPATTTPSFGFNSTPALGSGLGGGLGTSFQSKPVGSAFNLSGGGLFGQNNNQNTNFKTGLEGGLGGGLFNSNPTFGSSLPGLGTSFNTNNNMVNNSMSGSSAAGNVHEQILTLAARPYGDSPLFKDLLPDSSTAAEDALKPTNPAAVKAVLANYTSQYRVNSPAHAVRLQPRNIDTDKKSLFDGLEESDASLEDKLSLKPSRKRLILRPNRNSDVNSSAENRELPTNRSLEEPQQQRASQERAKEKEVQTTVDAKERERVRRSIPEFIENNNSNIEITSDRTGSWLNSPNTQWNEQEQVGTDPASRIYPNLDKELPNETSERRSSWLTTKPLRKPPLSNQESVENSVRELGVRTSDRIIQDKENIDNLSVSEDENVAARESPPHPTGVKLTRPGYYTIPSLDDMINYLKPDGSCVVPHLTIGRKNYGNVYYDCGIDVAGMDLDALVHFLNKEVIIYPEDSDKPAVGSGLNRRAIVTLDRIWPRDKTQRAHITDPARLLKMDYEGKLRRVCDKHDTKFIEYRPQTGSWVFRVEHFSKYGLTDSDEEDDITPEVMKKQIVNQSLQKASAPVPKPPVMLPVGLGGLGADHLSNLSANQSSLLAMHENTMFLNGTKAFEMDTTEDNNEGQSLYQDTSKAFGVKSPTSELARLDKRHSHNVQLMKASLYADAEMDDDISVSTEDQLVPQHTSVFTQSLPEMTSLKQQVIVEASDDVMHDVTPPALVTEEIPMRPLIVHPQTVVLKYHRKIPPLKNTIAGRLGCGLLADMSVCRARHSRAGWGPRAALLYVSTADAAAQLPTSADVSQLGRFTQGRSEHDWSEARLLHVALQDNTNNLHVQQILTSQLASILEWTEPQELSEDATSCPQARVRSSPEDRLHLLRRLIKDVEKYGPPFKEESSAYTLEVLKLCEALWGLDLENGGIPGTDELSIVNRHKKLIKCLTEAVANVTDADLKTNNKTNPDEEDSHSGTVWTLLLGGRVLEACKVCRDHGDYNLATLIAQASGDPAFRSLLSRQLSMWRECGSDAFISPHKMSVLQLLAGEASDLHMLGDVDWLRAFYATARYICPQVPSLEQCVRTYETLLCGGTEQDVSHAADFRLQFPAPPYEDNYHLHLEKDGEKRRIKDLRYELLRARAYNLRPRVHPHMYTHDHMDYSLGFILDLWFGNPSIENVTGLAEQLESAGLWHLAVQVLTFHPNDNARSALIQGVMSRQAPVETCSALQQVARLPLPARWLARARAVRALYQRQPLKEAEFLVAAGDWNAAHKVLVEKLLPDAVLSDKLHTIVDIVEALHAAYLRHEVSGWEAAGMALYHYIHVQEQIRALVSQAECSDRVEVQTQLEDLRPRVLAASKALANLKTKSVASLAAVTEMGARLVSLCAAARADTRTLVHTLAALDLPAHTTAQLTHKITQEIAEQASEMCVESSHSSPAVVKRMITS